MTASNVSPLDLARRRHPASPRSARPQVAFAFGLVAGHLSLECDLCGASLYPVRSLGEANSRAARHLKEAHPS